jgi:intracellular sulfur oxidation DsrE/DsrF family protein
MKTPHILYALVFLLSIAPLSVYAGKKEGNVACPVESPYGGMSFEDKFGDDVLDKMRCNKRRSQVKMVMQVNAALDGKSRMYGFRNLPNIINDFEKTHGIEKWEIAVVIHSGGFPFVLDPDSTNPHPQAGLNDVIVAAPYGNTLTGAEVVEKLIDLGVDVYFCLNTASALNITTDQMLPDVKYVPAGLSAIMDFQYSGYKYVQP